MIIDATRGSIARFVNHSCDPNCRMEKWTVNGKPRMALFAGDRTIMTVEELTYDYNFDTFDAAGLGGGECQCGSAGCRGVIGKRSIGQQPREKKASAGKGKSGGARKQISRKRRVVLPMFST